MAFFMVMWLTTQKKEVKEAVAGYFREPFATYKSTQKGAAATAMPVSDPMYGHTAQPQKRRLAISGDHTDYQFTVLFPVDGATIEPAMAESIKDFAPMMAGKLNRIEIRGHCLRRPLAKGSQFSNHWELCYARCQAVKQSLEAHGVEPERIRLSQAEGNEPLALNLAEEELKLNSRVDVILLPDLAEIPWARPRKENEPDAHQPPAAMPIIPPSPSTAKPAAPPGDDAAHPPAEAAAEAPAHDVSPAQTPNHADHPPDHSEAKPPVDDAAHAPVADAKSHLAPGR
jgi:outer membrane protein OmpA-like peptidoglycan-associated protein